MKDKELQEFYNEAVSTAKPKSAIWSIEEIDKDNEQEDLWKWELGTDIIEAIHNDKEINTMWKQLIKAVENKQKFYVNDCKRTFSLSQQQVQDLYEYMTDVIRDQDANDRDFIELILGPQY